MASSKGPTKGGRWLVELPYGDEKKPTNGKPGKSKLIRIKQGVAKFLGFKPVQDLPLQTVSIKTAAGERTIKRVPRVGAGGGRSITLILARAVTIGGKSVKTISHPLGSGCTNADAIRYYQKLGKGIVGVKTTEGRTIMWGEKK